MTAATFPRPRGRRPTIEWLPIDEMHVDDSYQRSIDTRASGKLIEQIAREWDWDLFDVLKVSIRPDDRRFVVDGQHRLAAARQRGDIDQLPCVLKRCAGAIEEAKLFIAANRGRKAMSVLDDYRAAVGAGDPLAVQIERMVTDAGLRMARASSPKGQAPGEIAIIAPIRGALKQRGEAVTAKALDLIGAAFPDEVLVSASCLFAALVDLLALTDAGEDALLHTLLKGTTKDWEQWAKLPTLRGGPVRNRAMRAAIESRLAVAA
ncbi:DUF6551 family protein [Sphingomonas sp. Leaf4]|uniref:DUF6551 family protein n=1 Tax=Sphingomonas sp. Leaf4 TaxID=2876553 RepID=UPI001E2E7891|nr:DUF6551 family protein [Sphingomonas sp. Leaf4]